MDPESYISNYPESDHAAPELLNDPHFREAIYRQLHPTPPSLALPLVRELFRREGNYRADESNDGEHFENLYWAALFLYQMGTLKDVIPMWDAKHISMDTGGGFDIQFLVGRGVMETIRYCRELNTPKAIAAAEYLIACQDAGDFDGLDTWLNDRIRYFDDDAN